MRSPRRTSLTSRTDRSCPTASGVSVSGSGTVSRSGSTGSVPGTERWAPMCTARSSLSEPAISITSRPFDRVAVHVDRHRARAALGLHERQLDAQHPVAIGGARGVGDDVRAQLDHAAERAEVDLELLVDALLGVGRPAMAGEHELAPLDLERQLVGIDARELGLDD